MLIHWIWLATRPSVSDRIKAALVGAFSDAEDVFFGAKEDYAAVDGLSVDGVESLCDKNLTHARQILEQCGKKQIAVCTIRDPEYPARLKQIPDPPLVLYYRGRLSAMEEVPVIAVVGTRKASGYGLSVAQRMGYQIASCGAVCVSGMAAGIDGKAMRGAILAGGSVIGVLGCGVDVVYPKSNRDLYEQTAAQGCILSEFPPETPPAKWNFPKRNRIISGLSNGVVVIEAPEHSGALITARQALEQGRDVFVVPGNVDVDSFSGSNCLLRDGAIYVRDGWDVVSEYESQYKTVKRRPGPAEVPPEEVPPQVAQKPIVPRENKTSRENRLPAGKPRKILPKLSDTEQAIVDLLVGETLVDDIIAETGMSAAAVLSALTVLQIKGIVRQLPGKRVALK